MPRLFSLLLPTALALATALPLALPLALATALPARALDLTALSEAERDAFRDEVRSYLLEHPEVLVEAINVLDSRRQDVQADADRTLVEQNATALFADGRSWIGGNPDGDVTLVEFMDYRCGYCKQAVPHVEALLRGDGNIRFILKEYPVLGPESELAARFAIAVRNTAGAEAYEQVHNALMTFRGEISEESLKALAREQGLDPEALFAALAAPEVGAEIADNRALARALQISGTPGFVIGDRLVRGYVPLEAMAQIVDQLRS